MYLHDYHTVVGLQNTTIEMLPNLVWDHSEWVNKDIFWNDLNSTAQNNQKT